MASGRWDSVILEIRRIAGLSAAATLSDRELIRSFVAKGDQAAFEVLVRRYGSMVFGVCRRVLGHAQDAEDAFQATFLVLVRKAATLKRGEAVANWLFGVAYRTALHAKSRSARRRLKESEVPPMEPEDSALEVAARQEILGLLDRALSRLPEKYRAPIVLCDLLGKTKKQAAEELRCPEGTVSSRLAHGRDLLRKRLGQHAETLTGVTGTIMLQQASNLGMPAALCMNTVKAAAMVAKGTLTAAGGLSPNVAAIMEGVMKSMFITKLKPLVAVVLAVACLGTAALEIESHMGAGQAKVAPEQPKSGKEVAEVARPVAVPPNDKEQPKKDQKPQLRYGGKDFDDWRKVLQTELKPEMLVEAIKALGAFGVNGYGEEATSAILEVMKKYDAVNHHKDEGKVLAEARGALARIGPLAASALANELKSKNVNDRRLAIEAVGQMDEKLAASMLARAFTDEDQRVRNYALYKFVTLGRWPPELALAEKQALVPALTEILKAKNEEDKAPLERAAGLLGWLGPEAKTAVPTLTKLLEEESLRFLDGVGKTAKGIGGKKSGGFGGAGGKKGGIDFESGSFPKGFSSGSTTDQNLRLAVVKALGNIGPDAKDAVPALIEVVKGSNESKVWEEVDTALERIGKGAVPGLIAALKDKESPMHQYHAAFVLAQIGPDAKEAVPALITWLSKSESHKRPGIAAAILALGRIGPAAQEAVPLLVRIRDAKSFAGLTAEELPVVQDGAKAALEKIQK